MKNKMLIIIPGIVAVIGLLAFLLIPNAQQSTCEQMDGIWNHDYCIMTQEIWDSRKFTCDPGPVMEDRYCHTKGIRIMIEPSSSSSPIEKLLLAKDIDYVSDTLAISRQTTFAGGDPGCGAVMDVNHNTHWFGIDSISEPKKMTLFSEIHNACKPNTVSCICNAHTILTEKTLTELEYFDPMQEEHVAGILYRYIDGGNYNLTPKFLIGKYNIDYDGDAIGFCGEFWGHSKRDYFLGWIENEQVVGIGVKKELPKLCAINEDTEYFGKVLGEK